MMDVESLSALEDKSMEVLSLDIVFCLKLLLALLFNSSIALLIFFCSLDNIPVFS